MSIYYKLLPTYLPIYVPTYDLPLRWSTHHFVEYSPHAAHDSLSLIGRYPSVEGRVDSELTTGQSLVGSLGLVRSCMNEWCWRDHWLDVLPKVRSWSNVSYNTSYDQDIYAFSESVNKWMNELMNKEVSVIMNNIPSIIHHWSLLSLSCITSNLQLRT